MWLDSSEHDSSPLFRQRLLRIYFKALYISSVDVHNGTTQHARLTSQLPETKDVTDLLISMPWKPFVTPKPEGELPNSAPLRPPVEVQTQHLPHKYNLHLNVVHLAHGFIQSNLQYIFFLTILPSVQ